METTGTSLSVSFYILAMAAITFISVYLITDTYEDEMTEDVAGESEAIARERAQRPARQSSLSGIEMLGRSISYRRWSRTAIPTATKFARLIKRRLPIGTLGGLTRSHAAGRPLP